jgi:tellurite resistance protein
MNDQRQTSGTALSRNAERLYRSMAYAYAAVACVDRRLTAAETRRFVDKIQSTPALEGLTEATIVADFNDIASCFFDNYDAAQREALDFIAGFKDCPEERAATIAAAQIALVADRDLKPQEEAIIAEICRTLGLDPEKF